MSNFIRVLYAVMIVATVNGCLLKKDAGTGDIVVSDDSSGAVSSGGGSVSATPTPNGMYCEGKGGGGGGDYGQQFDASNGRIFTSSMIAGSFVTSVKLKIKIGPTSGGSYIGTSTTYSTPLALKLYTCGNSGSKGSLQATANTTIGLYGEYKVVTFTFSSIAIPTASGCGTAYPAVFELIGTANMANEQLLVESEIAGSTCDAKFSNGGAGSMSPLSGRAWSAIISTTP